MAINQQFEGGQANAPIKATVTDLDGVLLKPNKSLFSCGLNGELLSANSLASIDDAVQQHGPDSRQAIQAAIGAFTSDTTGLLPHEVIASTRESGLWPRPSDYYAFTRTLLESAQQQGHRLFCVSRSPDFMVHWLLQRYGMPTNGSAPLFFKGVFGSTYERDHEGRLRGTAYTMGDKAIQLSDFFAQMYPGRQVRTIFALGNTTDDLTMLLSSEIPIAMCPEPELRENANEAGMIIVDETESEVIISGRKRHEVRIPTLAMGSVATSELMTILC